jgi:cob(I)alamin adenosyltransferase
MSIRIYTKTGDKGTTSLIGGTKVSKAHARIEAYGNVDELNSHIGLVSDLLAAGPGGTSSAAGPTGAYPAGAGQGLNAMPLLREVQDRLFTVGSSLACDPDNEPKLKIPDLHAADILLLEKAMDEMTATLPPMKGFVLPGGHPAVSTLHVARCVCRRAERSIVLLMENGAFVEPLVLQYINRLSDYLFVLASFTAHQWGIPEIIWKPRIAGA